MGRRGPIPWQPTDEERAQIELYVSMGYTQDQVAALIGKSVDIIQKYCRNELDNGALKLNGRIGGKLFQKCMDGDTTSLIFWAKTRMGWREARESVDVNVNLRAWLLQSFDGAVQKEGEAKHLPSPDQP